MSISPKRPPKIDIGSYEYVLSSVNDFTRDVIVYWQNIQENEKHTTDDSFEYRAYYTAIANNNTIILHPSNKTFANHATFVGLELYIGYNIRVYSANKDGLSTEYASIYIPSLPG
ncbi:cytokine receptor-like isoform X1, partial [Aphis craccivora]